MHPYRTRVSGTAVIGQGVVKHVWVAPNTASAAFSHREGSMVTQVAIQSRRPRNTHREVTYLQLGSPVKMACVWLCACICRQMAILIYLHPPRSICP